MSDLTLNEQYAVTCKGWRDCGDKGCWGPSAESPSMMPDYLSDDAELGRKWKALNQVANVTFYKEKDVYFCSVCKRADGFVKNSHGASDHEAAARACIALKLQVAG